MKLLIVLLISVMVTSFPVQNQDDLPINKIQVIGSHNSYKQVIDPLLFVFFKKMDSVSAGKIDYGHIGLSEQLDMGLRNLEIDAYVDSKGGKYAQPQGLSWVSGQAVYDTKGVMKEPGFKILHIPDLDFRTTVLTLKSALLQIKNWSVAHPNHTPIFITFEAKDDSVKRQGLTQPEKFTTQTFNELDKLIVENLGAKYLITPDQVRGKYNTLEEAVLKGNWPKLKDAKGKFLFILDAVGEKRSLYVNGHPSLKNRVFFTNSEPGTPEAATIISNNAKNPEIKNLVKKGYIIRTRADADTKQARENDRSYFDAACASGAQIITTDYYQKSTQFKSDYSVSFGDGKYFRLNPLFKN